MRTLALAILPLAAIADLHAQPAATLTLQPSARIRVKPVGSTTEVIGRVVELRGDTLHFASESGVSVKPLPISQIATLDTSAGMRGHLIEGTLVGAGIGGGMGAVIGAVSYTPCTDPRFMACLMHPSSRGAAAGMGMSAGAVVGALVGALAGATTRSERWDPVRWAKRASNVRPIISPTRAGLKLRF